MWKIVFPKTFYENLTNFLFSNSPSENGCFLLASSYDTKNNGSAIIVNDVIMPDQESWQVIDEYALQPTSSFINRAVVRADGEGKSLVFAHTHPKSDHPPTFSPIDQRTNKRVFANIGEILGSRPQASVVFSRHGISGVVYRSGRQSKISSASIVGSNISNIQIADHSSNTEQISNRYDRQVRAIGAEKNVKLQNLRITIVGVGGTGSALAVQLARMGVKNIRIIDRDVLDDTNITRVYGSTESDVGSAKVEVVKNHIEGFSKTKVEAIQADVSRTNLTTILIDSDVIYGCTDNQTSRSVLNDISLQYFIPYIDIGSRIHKKKDGSIDQIISKVQLVTPDSACLWCTGTLDGVAIMREALTKGEREKLREEGYDDSVEEQPSIISITTLAASMGVHKLLAMIGAFGTGDCTTRTQMEVKDRFLIDDSPSIKENCVCHKRRGIASARTIPLAS